MAAEKTNGTLTDLRACFEGAPVFVTGATGFIGSHLVRRLLDLGAEVSALVRSRSSAEQWHRTLPGVRFLEEDITDRAGLRRALLTVRPKHVFHLAAYTQVDRESSHADIAMLVNMTGTMRLTEAVDGLDVQSVVNSGTCEEYGDGTPPLSEESPLRPVSPYSVSKAAATLWCQMMHQTRSAPIVTVRPFLSYGPAQQPVRLIPQAILAALAGRDFSMTGGEQTREFTHVSDVVDGYLRAAVTPAALGQVVNLGSGEEHRIRDVVETIFALVGGPGRPLIGAVPYRAAELWRCVSSSDKARRLLGWMPRVRLEDGLRETVEWYRKRQPPSTQEARV